MRDTLGPFKRIMDTVKYEVKGNRTIIAPLYAIRLIKATKEELTIPERLWEQRIPEIGRLILEGRITQAEMEMVLEKIKPTSRRKLKWEDLRDLTRRWFNATKAYYPSLISLILKKWRGINRTVTKKSNHREYTYDKKGSGEK